MTPRTTSGSPAGAGMLLLGAIVACGAIGGAVGALLGIFAPLFIAGIFAGFVVGIWVVYKRFRDL
jgi:hypothetical protein